MVQSSITSWLQKPASVKKASDSATTTTPSPKEQRQVSLPPSDPVPDHAVPTKAETPNPVPLKFLSLSPLPVNVELVPLTEDLVPGFKRLNALTLPIPYPASYYTETMTEPHHGITLMALWHSKPPNGKKSTMSEKPRLVGAIRCRILPSSTLYISTLGLLVPFRSHGIASHLLQRVVVKAVEVHSVKCVTAHVWEANEEGMEWYRKRGFEVLGKEEGYYRKLKPTGAFLVRKWIGIGDLLGDVNTLSGKET